MISLTKLSGLAVAVSLAIAAPAMADSQSSYGSSHSNYRGAPDSYGGTHNNYRGKPEVLSGGAVYRGLGSSGGNDSPQYKTSVPY